MSQELIQEINHLRAEIQQLKKELSKEQHYKNEWKHQFLKIAKQNIEFSKQVEAAKTILSLTCVADCKECTRRYCATKDLRKVFSEGFSAEKSSLESAQNSGTGE